MVNYVLSFCKITAASRIFSRNFYLPLLKPLTPKDALRTLRITGKWLLGGKIQRYMPVLLNHRKKRSKRLKNYGKKAFKNSKNHDDYVFMMPILDEDNESHQLLLAILENYKNTNGVFVYTVDDRRYNIVLQSQFEKAIESGDVIDVLISKHNDKILVKLKNFKKIPIEIQCYDTDNNNNTEEVMYCGEGATTPEEEQFHHYGKYTMSLAKIFEDKEMEEELWEQELKRIMKRRRRQKKEGTKEWKQMMNETMKHFNWEKFEEDAKKIIDEINEPPVEQEIAMEIDDLEATKNVNEILLNKGDDLLNKLPTMTEIPDIIKNMANATLLEIETDALNKRRVSGVTVTLSSGKECFVSGQIVHTEEGDVFVPGQTIENEYGLEYAPGITINIDNKPTLINGLIMGEEQQEPMFLPTQSTVTADGQLTFAATLEERQQQTEINPQKFRNKTKQDEIVIDATTMEDELDDEQPDETDESTDSETIELNNSELEELDIEAIKLKHEQQRLELEKLKMILLDDGLDELIASLEQKNQQLKQKLDELRRLSMNNNTNLVTYINEDDTLKIAAKINDNYDIINRLSDILLIIIRKTANFVNRSNINAENIHQSIKSTNLNEFETKFDRVSNKLKILLKTLIVVANDVFKNRPKDQQLALNSIGEICEDLLKTDKKILDELLDLMNTSNERNEICNVLFKQLQQNFSDSKQFILKKFIDDDHQTVYDINEIINKIFKRDHDDDGDNSSNNDENEMKCEAFNKIIKTNPDLIGILKHDLSRNLKKIKTEEDAVELLNTSIKNTIKTFLKRKYNEILSENDKSALNDLKSDALGFAKALSLDDRFHNNIDNLLNDKQTYEFLQRVVLIKQLSEKDYTLRNAIERLKKNPERSRTDPRIRQLICESALLYPTIVKRDIKTSKDIPLQLIKQDNYLALEDYLIQQQFNKINCPILINRNLYQMIVPKDAARSVLNGRISYILIDENGITKFKPTHMYSNTSTNNINKNRDYLNNNNNNNNNDSDSGMSWNDRTVQQAKNNVRKLKKLFHNSRELA